MKTNTKLCDLDLQLVFMSDWYNIRSSQLQQFWKEINCIKQRLHLEFPATTSTCYGCAIKYIHGRLCVLIPAHTLKHIHKESRTVPRIKNPFPSPKIVRYHPGAILNRVITKLAKWKIPASSWRKWFFFTACPLDNAGTSKLFFRYTGIFTRIHEP